MSKKNTCRRIYLVQMDSSALRESGGHPRHFAPPFTLKYIQSLAAKNKDLEVKLVDCLVFPIAMEELVNNVLDWNTDLLVVSSFMHSYESALRFCSLVKEKKGIFAVVVGEGATVNFSDCFLPGFPFDIVLRGEAEEDVASIIKNLNEGMDKDEIGDFYRHKLSKGEVSLVGDLDYLPFPDYTASELQSYRYFYPLRINKKLRWGHILSSRGCRHCCIFCSQAIRETYGNRIRCRSPYNIIDEIEYLMAKGANIISFDDDNFSFSQRHIAEICSEIMRRRLKVKWIAHSRVDELNDSLIKFMKDAGCVLLRFGIESASGRIIKILNKSRSNINWIEASKDILSSCKKFGIATNALFMIGNPTETAEEIKSTIKAAKALDPDLIQVHFFTPYPGSKIYDELLRGGEVISRNDLSRMHHYAFPLVNLSAVGSGDLVKLRGVFYRKFLLNPLFISRHLIRYFLFYINNIEYVLVFLKILRISFQHKGGKSAPEARNITLSGVMSC